MILCLTSVVKKKKEKRQLLIPEHFHTKWKSSQFVKNVYILCDKWTSTDRLYLDSKIAMNYFIMGYVNEFKFIIYLSEKSGHG